VLVTAPVFLINPKLFSKIFRYLCRIPGISQLCRLLANVLELLASGGRCWSRTWTSINQELLDQETRLSDLTGLDEEVKFVRENILYPFEYKEYLSAQGVEPLKGIVFHGPRCVSKVSVAKAISAELSRITGQTFSFIQIERIDSDVINTVSSKNFIQNLFDKASRNEPAVVLIEDIESLIPHCSTLGKLTMCVSMMSRFDKYWHLTCFLSRIRGLHERAYYQGIGGAVGSH